MKRMFLILLTAVSAMCCMLYPVQMSARSGNDGQVQKVIRKYSSCDGVESINLGSFLLGIAKAASEEDGDSDFLKYVDRMSIFSGEDATASMKSDIADDFEKAFVSDGYEKMMEMKDGDDDMTIYCLMADAGTISEMVMYSRSEVAVILIKGSIPVSEMDKIIAEARE